MSKLDHLTMHTPITAIGKLKFKGTVDNVTLFIRMLVQTVPMEKVELIMSWN